MVVLPYRDWAKRKRGKLLVSNHGVDDVNMLPTEWSKLKHTLDALLAAGVSRPVPPALSEATAATAAIWVLDLRCRRCSCSAWQWGSGLISIFEEAEIRTRGLRCYSNI